MRNPRPRWRSNAKGRVEKVIEAAKTAHQLLIGAAVAVLFFVTAPDRLDRIRIRKAEAEVRALAAFDRRAYFQFLSAEADLLIEGSKRSLEQLGPLGVLPAIISTPLRCDVPLETATVRDWAAFANRRRQAIQTFTVAPHAVEGAMSGLKVQRASFPGGGVLERAWVGELGNFGESEPFLGNGVQTECFPLRDASASQFALFVVGKEGPLKWTFSSEVETSKQGMEGDFFLRWAKSAGWPTERAADSSERLLLTASGFADLSDKTPDQALAVIQDRMASLRGQASFLGLSVGVDQLAIAGPLGLLLLLVYLLAHLRHALRLPVSGAVAWIALFDDGTSRLLTALSLFLPVAAVLGLAFHRGASAGLLVGALQWLAVALVGGAAYAVFRALEALRTRIAYPFGDYRSRT